MRQVEEDKATAGLRAAFVRTVEEVQYHLGALPGDETPVLDRETAAITGDLQRELLDPGSAPRLFDRTGERVEADSRPTRRGEAPRAVRHPEGRPRVSRHRGDGGSPRGRDRIEEESRSPHRPAARGVEPAPRRVPV